MPVARHIWISLLLLGSAARVQAQTPAPMPMEMHHHDAAGDLFSAREASGTAWVPDDTPMFGVMRSWRGWNWMFHGTGFLQFVYEPGLIHRTGGFSTHQVDSVNWFMAAARRPAGSGHAGFRVMLSAEPWTVPGCGYLDLLATGEMCDGDTIHDRQHPHDLFMELAGEYGRPLRGSLRWQLYGGLAGEPALGPPGFPHRLSSIDNPIAPIGHHWLDATHVTFGLLTMAVYQQAWKAEVSVFNGREPDQNRTDLDLGPLDSVSGRFSFLPTPHLAIQVSAAHLTEAQAQFPPDPRTDLFRATVSATYNRELASGGVLGLTLAHGVNSGLEFVPGGSFTPTTQAVLAEGSLQLRSRDTLFARGEFVQKPGHDLHVHELPETIFPIVKGQAGYVRSWSPRGGAVIGAGGSVSLSVLPSELVSRYGSVAPGFNVFLTIRPGRHEM